MLEQAETANKGIITLFNNFSSYIKENPYLDKEEEMNKLIARTNKLSEDGAPIGSYVAIAALNINEQLFDTVFTKATDPKLLSDLLTIF